MARLAAILFLATGCTSQPLRDNEQAWRENECFQFADTPRRERCLNEARRIHHESRK